MTFHQKMLTSTEKQNQFGITFCGCHQNRIGSKQAFFDPAENKHDDDFWHRGIFPDSQFSEKFSFPSVKTIVGNKPHERISQEVLTASH